MNNKFNLKAIYWNGYITSAAMDLPRWFSIWREAALRAEQNESELVVFRIPKKHPWRADPDLISEIESFIQQKYGACPIPLDAQPSDTTEANGK